MVVLLSTYYCCWIKIFFLLYLIHFFEKGKATYLQILHIFFPKEKKCGEFEVLKT